MSIDLSLDRIKTLFTKFEAYTRQTVHIAGTNGKGSVSVLLASIFQHAGLLVGRFNSPHLLYPSDSISLNGVPVSSKLFQTTMDEVREKSKEHAINASNFEILTLCALLIFERARVDVVVLEVGMGGRLDATNVIPDECILVSVITAIDLDHQAFLGPTVDDIAREKAGIIRKGKPVVLSQQKYESVYAMVQHVVDTRMALLELAPAARERDWDEGIDGTRSPPFSLSPFNPPPLRPVEVELSRLPLRAGNQPEEGSGSVLDANRKYRVLLPLLGPHQLTNLGAALTVLHVLLSRSSEPFNESFVHARMDEKVIHAAVRECAWPGRLSFHLYRPTSLSSDQKTKPSTLQPSQPQTQTKPLVILVDGAHNESAASTLSTYVSSLLSSLVAQPRDATDNGKRTRRIRLTMLLALSHSPPKTPASVLVPLLKPFLAPAPAPAASATHTEKDQLQAVHRDAELKSRIRIRIRARLAFLGFSPPEGMPWVKPVPPSTMYDVVRASFPDGAVSETDFWIAPNSDRATIQEQEQDALQSLKDALRWATAADTAKSHDKDHDDEDGGESHPNAHADLEADADAKEDTDSEDYHLVLIAGSLYLVADFYRLLRLQELELEPKRK